MGCTNTKTSQNRQDSSNVLKISNNDKSLEFKVVLLGDAGVGKSSICQRYINNKVNETYEVTIGGAYLQKTIPLKNGAFLRLHLWDTGGEERFKAMAPLYYRDANAAILVYDVSNLKSFQNLQSWIFELESRVRQDRLTLILAANKCDLEQDKKEVPNNMAKSFAGSNNMLFFEVSALKSTGILEMFKILAEELSKKSTNLSSQQKNILDQNSYEISQLQAEDMVKKICNTFG